MLKLSFDNILIFLNSRYEYYTGKNYKDLLKLFETKLSAGNESNLIQIEKKAVIRMCTPQSTRSLPLALTYSYQHQIELHINKFYKNLHIVRFISLCKNFNKDKNAFGKLCQLFNYLNNDDVKKLIDGNKINDVIDNTIGDDKERLITALQEQLSKRKKTFIDQHNNIKKIFEEQSKNKPDKKDEDYFNLKEIEGLLKKYLKKQKIKLKDLKIIDNDYTLKRITIHDEDDLEKNISIQKIEEHSDAIQKMTGTNKKPEIHIENNLIVVDIIKKSPKKAPFSLCLDELLKEENKNKLLLPIGYNPIAVKEKKKNVFSSLGEMPHLLIAGATGQGKSSCLNSIITALILANSPLHLSLILVDPKRVEMSLFDKSCHLFQHIISGPNLVQEVQQMLDSLVVMMDERFTLFQEQHFRGIKHFNEDNGNNPVKLPYIVLIIDEYASIITDEKNTSRVPSIEKNILKLSSLSRAAGIHMILATQSPSKEVVTPLIKANFPSRIALTVRNEKESNIIIDKPGAESLFGEGDMFYHGINEYKPFLLKGFFIDEKDIEAAIDTVNDGCQKDVTSKKENEAHYYLT